MPDTLGEAEGKVVRPLTKVASSNCEVCEDNVAIRGWLNTNLVCMSCAFRLLKPPAPASTGILPLEFNLELWPSSWGGEPVTNPQLPKWMWAVDKPAFWTEG